MIQAALLIPMLANARDCSKNRKAPVVPSRTMFSYRHSFHAGNHADVLKHLILISCLRYLTSAKETPLRLIDIQAGAGLYRLDGENHTHNEAAEGILPLWQRHVVGSAVINATPAALKDYLDLLLHFNPDGVLRKYPGSPFIAATFMRSQDHLHLFELHPTDSRLLANNVDNLPNAKHVQVVRNNGFTGLKALLPPPSRRGLVLIDPSYELKTDYAQVTACIQDALQRFATGCYLIWYPIIPRPQAHELPRRLKTLAQQASKKWLHATLSIGKDGARADHPHQGLRASGMVVINPPFVLHNQLQEALPALQQSLPQGVGCGWHLESNI